MDPKSAEAPPVESTSTALRADWKRKLEAEGTRLLEQLPNDTIQHSHLHAFGKVLELLDRLG